MYGLIVYLWREKWVIVHRVPYVGYSVIHECVISERKKKNKECPVDNYNDDNATLLNASGTRNLFVRRQTRYATYQVKKQ